MRRPWLVVAMLVLSRTHALASNRSCACTCSDAAVVAAGEALALVGVVALTVGILSYLRRVQARRAATAEPISLLVAERLARAVQRRAGVVATVCLVGVPTLVITEASPLAILSTIVGCIGVRGFFVARAVLQLIERGGDQVTAEARGPTITVRDAANEVQLEVGIDALARARRHAGVPGAIPRAR